MDPIRNPYAPGAGSDPPELAGRAPLLEQARIAIERLRAGRHARSFIAVGLRGVGKTVLLNRIARQAADADYRVCMIEAEEDKDLPDLIVPHLRRTLLELDRMGALAEQVKRALRILKSFLPNLKFRYADTELSLDIEPEQGTADSGDLEADLATLFVAIGEAARARKVAVGIMIDEIQCLTEAHFRALILAMHRVSQAGLPLLLTATGLPQVVGLIGEAKTYAERLFDFPTLAALSEQDAADALQRPAIVERAKWDDAALILAHKITHGYPYFLQVWGYHTWNHAAGPAIRAQDVRAATNTAIARLDEGFFRVRFDRSTPRERAYLRAMAEIGPGPHRSGDIADRLGAKVQSVGPLRAGLIRKGMIYSPAYGDTAFTVPLFDEYLRRTMPVWRPRDH